MNIPIWVLVTIATVVVGAIAGLIVLGKKIYDVLHYKH